MLQQNSFRINTTRFLTKLLWLIAPQLTIRIVNKIHFKPKRPSISIWQKELLTKATTFQVPVLGKMVRGWKWGVGPTIIMVHGWGSCGIRFSGFIKPLIETGFSVVAYDSPAHGESEGTATNYFEFIETIRVVANIQDSLYGVIAHSMGTGAAMNLAIDRDHNLKSVLISPMYDLEKILYDFVDGMGIYQAPFRTMIHNLESEFGKRIFDVSPVAISNKLKSPVLIFHDENDNVTPFGHSVDLLQNLDDAELIKTTGLGHSRILRDEEVIRKTVLFFQNSFAGEGDAVGFDPNNAIEKSNLVFP